MRQFPLPLIMTVALVISPHLAAADNAIQLTTIGGENPTWSPDSLEIAFASPSTGHLEIWKVPATGGAATQVSFIDGPDQQGGMWPAWSPDGSQIAFNKFNLTTMTMDIWKVPAAGGAPATPIPFSDFEAMPAWSPGGSRIAFVRGSETGNDIWTMLSGGGGTIRVTTMGDALWPNWSPDGASIAFASISSGNIYVSPSGGGAAAFLVAGLEPAYTPDGNYIGLVVGDEICVIAASGGDVQQLTDEGGERPTWCPDGTAVAFNRGGQIWALDVDEDDNGIPDYNTLTAVGEDRQPARFALYPNVPNPFNPTTMIRYDLLLASRVSLRVYDVSGRLVRVLRDGNTESAGQHEAKWDGRDGTGRVAPSGVYFYRLETGNYAETRKMVMLK